jgi:hypothetical protein
MAIWDRLIRGYAVGHPVEELQQIIDGAGEEE